MKVVKIECIKCHYEIANFSFKKHFKCCNGSGPTWRKKGLGGKKECEKCHYEIGPQNFTKHFNSCDGIGPRRKSGINRGRGRNWKKGKTNIELFGEEKAKSIREKTSKTLTGRKGHPVKKETRKLISIKMAGNTNWKNSIHKSGRGEKGYFQGHYFMSSWELAYIVYCLENNIRFKRNWESFEYYDENNLKRFYIPDFYLIDKNIYVEVKGYKTIRSELKLQYFPHPIEVIYKKEIQ